MYHRLSQKSKTTFLYDATSLHLDTLHTIHVGRPINEFKCNSTKSGRSFDEKYLGSSFPALFLYPQENEKDKGIDVYIK